MTADTASPADLSGLGRVHVVGIGGAGMSGIARILVARGVTVSGSDAKDSRRITALRALGVDAVVGHDAANVEGVDTVIASTAIKPGNPEIVAAHEHGLRVMGRAEALATLMQGYRGIAVAGTHGKTTTTSMLTVALQHCGADPSFAIGSELNESGSNAHLGTGVDFVAEADESDGAFLALPASAGIVTNVEPDHLDHWGTFEAIEQAFLEFCTAIAARGGFVTVCADDDGAARLAETARAAGVDVRTYGESESADYRVQLLGLGDNGWRFDVLDHGVRLGAIELGVPARHNVLNATAALVTGIGLGHSPSDLRAGLESFSGTRRRFDFKGTADGVRVYDDYAHHPTEIAATLRRCATSWGRGSSSSPSRRTTTTGPRCSRRSSARRSGSPTRSSCSRSSPRARSRSPARPAWRWRRTSRCLRSRSCSSRRGAASPDSSSTARTPATSS